MRSVDVRYKTIKPMYDEGTIQKFSDIFVFIPKTVVLTDLGKNNKRFNEMMEKVDDFQIKEILAIARLCNLTGMEMFILVDQELGHHELNKKKLLKNSDKSSRP